MFSGFNILKLNFKLASFVKHELFLSIQASIKLRKWLGSYDYEKISVGENCNSSWYLKETNNKKASYPFDWIFSSPMIILDLINSDFKYFLDKNQIFSINKGESAGHKLYHLQMFNHKNPYSSVESLNYYKRAVERFQKKLYSEDPILFVCTVLNESLKRKDWSNGFTSDYPLPVNQNSNDFLIFKNFLKSKNSNIKLLCVEQNTESLKRSIDIDFIDEDICWVKFNSAGKNNGVKYLNFLDDLVCKLIYFGLN